MSKLKLKNKYSLLSLLLIILSSFLLFAGTVRLVDGRVQRANAQVNVEISKEIAEEYAFGDSFTLPDCTFTRNGDSAKGLASLQFPDGTQTGVKDVTLNQSGKYVLRYIANIDDKVYTKEYDFTVYGRLASYSNSKTSMTYGTCTDFGANSTGLMVQIANGDSLTFDHVFEMSKLSMATKLLEGFIVPTTQGIADFSRMVFTFTDIQDPSVQLVYYGNFHNDSNAYGLTYFTAAGNGQIHCGLEHIGRLHVGSTLGCMVPHSFMAMDTGLYYGAQRPEKTAPDAKTFCISYDGKTNQAWAGGKIISDLDDSNYYDTLWFGFPSGKAKLTISALNYNNATANICFTSILGVDLSAQNFIDEEAPIITVDSEYDVMPNAVVGGSYPIPTATALDQVNGVCDVKVSVWYNYGAETQKMVDVKENAFAVKNVGVYAIVYESSDYSGNVSREVLWVRANLSQYVSKLSVSIDSSYHTEIEVGVPQQLPAITVTGGSGDIKVVYSITKGKQVCEIVNGTFTLEEAGEWLLTCTVSDYAGNAAIAVCNLKGVLSNTPIVVNQPQFPAAYISEAAYQLPKVYAYIYNASGRTEQLCDVSVTCNGKTQNYKAGEVFQPVVSNSGDKVTLIYSCNGVKLIEKEIPVIIVFEKERIPGATERYRDVVKTERYFYTDDNLTFTNNYELAKISGLKITANQATESAKAAFINPQMANNFSLDFMTVPNASKFSQLNVTLTDSVNSDISIKACLVKDEGQTKLVVGDTVLSLMLDFDDASSAHFNLGFNNNHFVVNSTTSIAVTKTESGAPFNGFTSGKVYFELEMCNAEAQASIFLSKISNINLNNTQDTTGPFLTTAENVETNAFKDSVYTVQKVLACDVLCPNVDARLTVMSPNGTPVTSVNGVVLQNVDATVDYQINLTAYGDYYVSVVAKEANWKYANESYFEYTITVADGEAPTITFEDSFKTSLKVGDMLVIPKYTVSDNYTKEENITVMITVINPEGMPIHLYGNENGIRCQYTGEYKVIIYVYDEMGNLTTFETSVTVK